MNDNEDQYKRLRDKWEHEDEVINHRLTWLLVSQTILFAGWGALLEMAQTTQNAEKIGRLIQWVPFFGILTSLLILVSIVAATVAMVHLKSQNASIQADPKATKWGLFAPIGLPVVFIAAWVAALVI